MSSVNFIKCAAFECEPDLILTKPRNCGNKKKCNKTTKDIQTLHEKCIDIVCTSGFFGKSAFNPC